VSVVDSRFADLLPLVDEVIQFVVSRHHLSATEAEDFGGFVRLRLLEDQGRVFRCFAGRSQPRTYLVAVLSRFLLDFRESLWGRWRPSAAATRLGPTAVLLEELMVRDALPFDEAVAVMQTTHRVTLSREALLDLLHELPMRLPRLTVSENEVAGVPSTSGAPEEGLEFDEHRARVARIEGALGRAFRRLSEGDRLIVMLRFVDDLFPPQIARICHMDVRPVYRRLDEATSALREAMMAEGITADEVAGILGHPVAGVGELLPRRRWRAVHERHAN
jgi:DNA-directed RNA polymerase specialized sigma24 family protein